jgi:hypothetical protein
LVKNWLFNQGIQLIDVPPYSPDYNQIEIEALKQFIVVEWNNTSVYIVTKASCKHAKALCSNC